MTTWLSSAAAGSVRVEDCTVDSVDQIVTAYVNLTVVGSFLVLVIGVFRLTAELMVELEQAPPLIAYADLRF